MAQKPKVLVDTDVLIKTYRGSKSHKHILDALTGQIAVSSVTYLELLYGLKNRERMNELHKQMRSYQIVHLSESISKTSIEILNRYAIEKTIGLADALIAASALVWKLSLFTDNRQDFHFIKGLKFFESH